MKLKQVTGICFSPTESTKKVVSLIAEQIRGSCEMLDITDAVSRRPDYSFTENEAVVIGVPVYGGRVPKTAAERLRNLHGRETPAILVVTYGNRAYEDALIELKETLTAQGFHPVAAAAVAAEHNMIRGIAKGRPDDKDKQKLKQFGQQADELLCSAGSTYQLATAMVKGNVPYRQYHTIPLKIKTTSACNKCGLCIKKCPVQAISRTDPKITDRARCITCMRCIKICPVNGRRADPFLLFLGGRALKKACARRKEPEFFF